MNIGEAVREATRGVWKNPWLLLPLAVALAYGALGWLLVQSSVGARLASGYTLIGSLLSPAFLAWWVGWAGEAAQGRRLRPQDMWPTLAQGAGPMYMILFIYSIGMVVLSRIFVVLAVVGALVPLVLNPWIDFAAAGDLRLDRIQDRMREPMYWIVAATGLLFGGLALVEQISFLGPLSIGAPTTPPLSVATVVVYAVATWLWAVRANLLHTPGAWHNARMRRFLRDSQRRYDDEAD